MAVFKQPARIKATGRSAQAVVRSGDIRNGIVGQWDQAVFQPATETQAAFAAASLDLTIKPGPDITFT